MKIPNAGDVFRYNEQNEYVVIGIAENQADKENPNVVYLGFNGKLWIKTLKDFHEKMEYLVSLTEVKENIEELENITYSLIYNPK